MSDYQVGDKVSKVNVNGKVGSARIYEIATVVEVATLDAVCQRAFEGNEVIYTLRKVGGKGKGGCWYEGSQLIPA